tara:strand:+ start:638 stop:1102 length:465 start_codon:yes stop_codon:yes gene_type:complete
MTVKKFYIFILFFSIVSLLGAVYIEYILQEKPCKLCLYQRIPYLAAIFISFFGYNFNKNLLWLYLLLIIFIVSVFLSGYHAGIENNIFNEYSGCSVDNLNLTNKTELLNSLKNSLPNCKDVNFRIFGLSLATLNFIISIIVTVFIVNKIINEKK